jgi:hypothetical protein
MANVKLTHNMRFFKEKERSIVQENELVVAMQQIVNEFALYRGGNQNGNTTLANVKRLIVNIEQLSFRAEELGREIACTPFFVRG